MRTVLEILKGKGPMAWSVGPETTVFDALSLMAEKNIGALLVLEGGRVLGIFSERDYARRMILLQRRSKDTPVREVMSPKVLYVTPERTVEECMALMTDKHVRHLPVLEGERLCGVVSIGDVVKAILSQKDHVIEELERYIRQGA